MRILLIGLPAAGRLESVKHALGESVADVQFEAAHSIPGCRSMTSSFQTPAELILVFQDWPEQYSVEEADWLLSNHQTSRILCVYGGWCESDGRTRQVWPHAVRVPNWRLQNRLRREIRVLAGHTAPLPVTASRRERFVFEHAPPHESVPFAPHAIRIVTADRGLGESLSQLLGGSQQSGDPPDVVFFDVDPWDPATRSRLRSLVERYPRARLIALAGFPNHIPIDEITATGAETVLPKLLTQDMLADMLAGL